MITSETTRPPPPTSSPVLGPLGHPLGILVSSNTARWRLRCLDGARRDPHCRQVGRDRPRSPPSPYPHGVSLPLGVCRALPFLTRRARVCTRALVLVPPTLWWCRTWVAPRPTWGVPRPTRVSRGRRHATLATIPARTWPLSLSPSLSLFTSARPLLARHAMCFCLINLCPNEIE